MNFIGKNAVCVGGTSGIGMGIAIRLAQAQANVTIIGRNKQAGNEIVNKMKEIHPHGEYLFIACDASLMAEVKKCCTELKQSKKPIHYLVVSQGIASMKGYDATVEGLDNKLALHYYGRMKFIMDLLPVLNETADGGKEDVRVLSVLSGGVHSPVIFHDDLLLKKNFTIPNAANVAGFYNDLGLNKLAQLNPHIGFIHAAPGFVSTSWGSGFPWIVRGAVRLIQLCAMSPEQCANNMCKAFTNTNMNAVASANKVSIMGQSGGSLGLTGAHTAAVMDEVWNHTVEVLKPFE